MLRASSAFRRRRPPCLRRSLWLPVPLLALPLALVLALLLATTGVVRGDEFAFFDAVAEGDASTVAQFIADGLVDVNYPDENGELALVLAARAGHADAVAALLDGGANVAAHSTYPADANTALTAAAGAGQEAVVELLLARKGQGNGEGAEGAEGSEGSEGSGVQVDQRGHDGRTPLMAAAARGQLSMVQLFLDKGADVEATKADGTTALFWAAHEGHAPVVALLAGAGAEVRKREFIEGAEPIHFAAQHKPPGNSSKSDRAAYKKNMRLVLQHLLTFGAAPGARTGVVGPRNPDGTFKEDPKREELTGGRTPLMMAAASGNLPAIEVLLGLISEDNGSSSSSSSSSDEGEKRRRRRRSQEEDEKSVDVDAVDVQGLTALSLAAAQGRHKAVAALLRGGGGSRGGGSRGGGGASAGASVDIPNNEARAALHLAAFGGHLEVVKKLVRAGATVDQPSALTNGVGPAHTPLLLAANQGHYKTVRYLLRRGANPNFAAKDGATPLIAAASADQKRVVKALLRAGGDPRRRLEGGETASVVANDKSLSRLLRYKE
jgi:ankyrin repeat protein